MIYPEVRYPPLSKTGQQQCVFCGLLLDAATTRCPRVTWVDPQGWLHE